MHREKKIPFFILLIFIFIFFENKSPLCVHENVKKALADLHFKWIVQELIWIGKSRKHLFNKS